MADEYLLRGTKDIPPVGEKGSCIPSLEKKMTTLNIQDILTANVDPATKIAKNSIIENELNDSPRDNSKERGTQKVK